MLANCPYDFHYWNLNARESSNNRNTWEWLLHSHKYFEIAHTFQSFEILLVLLEHIDGEEGLPVDANSNEGYKSLRVL